jgi:hypothetical protein
MLSKPKVKEERSYGEGRAAQQHQAFQTRTNNINHARAMQNAWNSIGPPVPNWNNNALQVRGYSNISNGGQIVLRVKGDYSGDTIMLDARQSDADRVYFDGLNLTRTALTNHLEATRDGTDATDQTGFYLKVLLPIYDQKLRQKGARMQADMTLSEEERLMWAADPWRTILGVAHVEPPIVHQQIDEELDVIQDAEIVLNQGQQLNQQQTQALMTRILAINVRRNLMEIKNAHNAEGHIPHAQIANEQQANYEAYRDKQIQVLREMGGANLAAAPGMSTNDRQPRRHANSARAMVASSPITSNTVDRVPTRTARAKSAVTSTATTKD